MKISSQMTNLEIAELLRAVAASYQIAGEEKNRFRIVAYERAADAVEHASSELKDLWDEGKLEDVAGIGKSIAGHLNELFKTGKSAHFNEVMKGLPPAMFDLMIVPGIGAKTAYKLVKKLGISENDPLGELTKAAKEGKIAPLEGFGEESQKDILRSIAEVTGRTKRHILPYAAHVADEIIAWLKTSPDVKKADPLGSLRRRASTVGDVDVACATEKPEKVLDYFVHYPKTQRVLEKGTRTASIVIPGDTQVDLMVQPTDAYGALLQHFTGSKHHNIALREYALKKNFSLSEYGIREKGSKGLKKFATEKEFYNYLGLEWIPPELREDNGEIEAARSSAQAKPGGLPKLVETSDIKADLQIHSDFDIETSHDVGQSSMEDIAAKADGLGYEYVALTEHNPSHSRHSRSQILDLLKRKKEKVERLNGTLTKKFKVLKRVFNSLEIDILPQGQLPVPDEGFEYLDFALVSVHSSFRIPRQKMTERVLSALDHPKIKIFAHPTARLLGKREGIDLDWVKLTDFCKSHDIWLEINADPMRLDLPDFLVKDAKKAGIKFTFGTDSHHADGMDNMANAVSVARRGWAEKADIINCLTLKEFLKVLKL